MIIVTGANGFIGSCLIWDFNQNKRTDLVAVDTVSLRERPAPLTHRKYSKFLLKDEIWSFLDKREVIDAVEAVVHMGACSSTTEMNVAFLKENNVEYTKHLWSWCARYRKKFIYASSGAVYGDGSLGFDDQISPDLLKPLNPYGESKVEFDRWALRQGAVPPLWIGLRFFNVYGPNESHKGEMASVVYKAFEQIRKSGSLRLFRSHHPDYKDGHQMRDFVYVKDITRWILEMIESSPPSGIYNMGYGRARTWLDLAQATFASMGTEMKIEWIDVPESIRDRYQYFTEAKMDRLINAAGLSTPTWSLEKGIADYIKGHLEQVTGDKDQY